MERAQPLPSYLVHRYQGWKATGYADNQSWYRQLAEQGQHPRAMVISCCDSRVHVTAILPILFHLMRRMATITVHRRRSNMR